MIMLKLGFFCSFIIPAIRSYKSKVTKFLFYTRLIPLITYLLYCISNNHPTLLPSYGEILITLVVLLWLPTIYGSYQREYWSSFPFYTLRLSLLLFFLCMAFSRQNLLNFYIFFELALVPIMFILFKGGKSSKKYEAGLYMFAFTSSSAFLFFSFLIFCRLAQHGIGQFFLNTASTYDAPLKDRRCKLSPSLLIYNLATIIILVKTPIFFLHIWLPKAHVEAPVFASIILARLLLKTGGYGYLILLISHFGALAQFDLSVCGIIVLTIFGAVRCSNQIDIKMLIAYSSVNHIRIIVCGIILGLSSSVLGRVLLIIGHGVISSALFFLARDSYVQMGTRSSFFSLVLGKSNVGIFSWLILTFINAGLPPFLIFIGEALILKSVLIYPTLIFLFFINYVLIGYYSCLILVKLVLSKFPTMTSRLRGVGIPPYKCNSIVLLQFLVLLNITICYPWLR